MNDHNTSDEEHNFDIAIIGMSARLPGANSVDEFWQNLCTGVESISFFSDEELTESGIDPALLSDPNYIKASPTFDDPGLFDASFFGYSPKEAQYMDPQHRLFLECAWKALEHAGYDAESYAGPIGVYGGGAMNTYLLFSGLFRNFYTDPLPILIGNDKDFLTTRVSYKLNLRGPGVTVQTGCSTSLVAVHLACQSLLNCECDMALAGGVSVRIPHNTGYLYHEGSIVSPDGHCRAFDAKAKGTIFGSGVGIVVLKRLEDAVADKDCIHAVIKGCAINNDGSSKIGYTAPSVNSQSEVIVEALANSGIGADTITYIEAHGTGTNLGDPIEIAALTNAFRTYTDKKSFCAVGSVKSNIGHLDTAAGAAGLIKTILALKYKMIPPSLHFEKANPEIDFENSPFYVNTTLSEWNSNSHPRRAGVTALGVGGTNAHVVLEEAPAADSKVPSRPYHLLPLSAKTETALEAMSQNLAQHVKNHPDANLADIAYTLQVGRKIFNHRRVLVASNPHDAASKLEHAQSIFTQHHVHGEPFCVFMFPGQGAQHINMARELYQLEPEFQEQVDLCAELLKPHLESDLRSIMYPTQENAEKAKRQINQTAFTQPAIFVIEYALAKLWMAWGIHAQAMIGHSIGELTAACLAGVFSLKDALAVIATRGRLMQELPPGDMLVVRLPEQEILPLLGEDLDIAAVNGPSLCVVSGPPDAAESLTHQLDRQEVVYRLLHTSHAFHSKMMDPAVEPFTEYLKKIHLASPQIPFISTVHGSWISEAEATDPKYWAKHLRHPVRFAQGVEELFKEPERILLEVGPGQTLSTLARQNPHKASEQPVFSSAPHAQQKTSDLEFLLTTLGRLWLVGVPVDWAGFYVDGSPHRIPLPSYPFERKRYWIHAGKQQETGSTIQGAPEDLVENSIANQTRSDRRVEKTITNNATNDDIEQALIKIWQESLGVEQIGIQDDFFDLGGSSLVSVDVFSRIKDVFGKNLSPGTLIEAPTIEQLARILHDEKETGRSLVTIRQGGGKPPFFFIHAAGGNVLYYRDIARYLSPDQPVYGLQARGLEGDEPILTRIEDMAESYIKEIQSVQPDGPYFLGGYCMGGTVALEMAQQLQSQGKSVAFVGLFETYNFHALKRNSLDSAYYYLQKIEFHARNFLLLPRHEKKIFLMEKLKVAWNRRHVWYGSLLTILHRQSNDPEQKDLLPAKIWAANDLACVEYEPKKYPGRITQFLPTKEYACYSRPEAGWENLATESVETYRLPMYPAAMFLEPFVRKLARQLQECLDLSLKEAASSKKVLARELENTVTVG